MYSVEFGVRALIFRCGFSPKYIYILICLLIDVCFFLVIRRYSFIYSYLFVCSLFTYLFYIRLRNLAILLHVANSLWKRARFICLEDLDITVSRAMCYISFQLCCNLGTVINRSLLHLLHRRFVIPLFSDLWVLNLTVCKRLATEENRVPSSFGLSSSLPRNS